MLQWALIFLVVALIAGAMGFGGINVHVVLEGTASSRRRSLSAREREVLSSAQDAELVLLALEHDELVVLHVGVARLAEDAMMPLRRRGVAVGPRCHKRRSQHHIHCEHESIASLHAASPARPD